MKDGSSTKSGGADLLGFFTTLLPRFYAAYQANLAEELALLFVPGSPAPRNLAQTFVPPTLHEWLPETSGGPGSVPGETPEEPQGRATSPGKPLDIWEAMRRFPHLALVGPPGIGKSTLLRYLAWQCASGTAPRHQIRLLSFERHDEPLENLVPVYVPLTDPSPADEDLLGRIVRIFAAHGFPRAGRFLQARLERGECLLLFDGLSEIADERERGQAVAEIVALARRYGRNQIVVAARTPGDLGLTRSAGSRGQAAGDTAADGRFQSADWGLRRVRFGVVEHGGFSGEGAREFVRRWFGAQGGMGGGLLHLLEQSPGLSEIAGCPLCLTAMVAVEEGDAWLRGTRLTPAFDASSQALLRSSDGEARPDEEHSGEVARAAPEEITLLEDMAEYLHIHRARKLASEQVLEAAHLSSPETVLSRVVRSHFLQQDAEGSYQFAHPAWQAYFAARALSRSGDATAAVVLDHADDPWWQDVIAFLAGQQRDATDLIRDLYEHSRSQAPCSEGRVEALFLAARCMRELQPPDTSLRDEILGELLAIFQREEPDLWPRASAAMAGVLGKSVSEAFPELLETGPVERRAAAALALGRIGGEWAMAPIRKALWDEDWRVRGRAAWALGRIGGAASVQRLIETLSDTQAEVRASAVEALVALGGTAAPSLIGSLGDRRPFVSEAAVDALSRIGPSTIGLLIEALGDQRQAVRDGAKHTLALIGEPALGSLGEALRDRRLEICSMAAVTIGLINGEQAAATLTKALGDGREAVRREVIVALRKMGAPAVRPLIAAAADEEPRVSERAIDVLEGIGEPALEDLFEALANADSSVRWVAARALGQIGVHHEDVVIKRLQDLIQHDQRDGVRRAAVEALIGIGNDRVVPALVTALDDKEKFIRERAGDGLRAMATPTVVHQLRSALDRGANTDVIIDLLGAIRTDEAKAVLRELTRYPDPDIADKAALILEADTSSGFYFYRMWASRIEENLFTRGRFTTLLLTGVPEESREVVLQRYIEDHPDQDLEYDAEAGVLEIRDFSTFRDLIGHDTIQSLQDAENLPYQLFAEYATKVCHALCDRMGLAKPSSVSYKRWLAFVIHASSIAYGTKLPEVLPLLFLHGAEPDPADLADLRHLLPNELGIYHKTALLVHFKDEPVLERLKQAADRELRAGYAFDVVVLGAKDIQKVITAKDPARVVRFLICDQADLTVISPYSALGPAEPSMFFGRDLEIKQITHAVGRTSVAVLGGRRIGKTSVLRKVARVLGDHYQCLEIDCHPLRNYRDLFKTIGERWPDVGVVEADPLNFYTVALTFRRDKSLLFLLDEVDALLEFDLKNGELLFKTFRKLFNEGICWFIISGNHYLNRQLRYGSELGLFNFCGQNVVLGYLEAESARKLVTEPMARLNVHLRDEKDVVRMILDASSCHPRLIQYICHMLITHINQERGREITPEHVERITGSSDFKEEYLTTLWGRANPLERIITLLLVLQGGRAVTTMEIQEALEAWGIRRSWADLKEALDNLELYSLLKRGNGTYSFVPPNFVPTVAESQNVELLIDDLRRKL